MLADHLLWIEIVNLSRKLQVFCFEVLPCPLLHLCRGCLHLKVLVFRLWDTILGFRLGLLFYDFLFLIYILSASFFSIASLTRAHFFYLRHQQFLWLVFSLTDEWHFCINLEKKKEKKKLINVLAVLSCLLRQNRIYWLLQV